MAASYARRRNDPSLLGRKYSSEHTASDAKKSLRHKAFFNLTVIAKLHVAVRQADLPRASLARNSRPQANRGTAPPDRTGWACRGRQPCKTFTGCRISRMHVPRMHVP